MFGLPYSAKARADLPFDPSHSWLLGERQRFAFVFAIVVTLAFIAASAAILWGPSVWPEVAIVASVLSLVLLVVFASRWWAAGYLISSVALAIAAWKV